MAGYRQLHTRMWASDQWFADLTPEMKLLFIYTWSNERASVCGLYELPVRLICFETGLPADVVERGLQAFEQAKKIEYDAHTSVIWVKNMFKYQGTQSPQIQKRIVADIKQVPDCDIKKRFILENRVLIGYTDGTETLLSISSPLYSSLSIVEGGGAGEGTSPITIPATPRQALANPFIQAYRDITGIFPGDRDYAVIVDAFAYFAEKHGQTYQEYLRPYWSAWSTRKTRDGKSYNPSSRVWYCEWAMQGSIPAANGHEPQIGEDLNSVIKKVSRNGKRS